MPAHPRKDSVDPEAVEVHHIWSRCVQRAWLCGIDPLTGVDYSHRRIWIESLLEYQAGVFAIDVGGYHVLSNHLHGILRTRPDIAREWSDEEVAWRWKLAWPTYEQGRWVREPTDDEIRELLAQGEQRIAQLRMNLSSLSWLMARWKEPIAKMANRESDRRGHYFEQRFGNRRLEDDREVVTAFLYNDLQQLAAGIVDSVELSDFSSIQRHIRAEAEKAVEHFQGRLSDEQYEAEVARVEVLYANCFLAPVSGKGALLTTPDERPAAPSELILPAGYVTIRDQQPASDAELVADSEESGDAATDAADDSTVAADAQGPPTRGARRRRSASSRRIHNRLRQRQRRRASRQSVLNVPWEQYVELLTRAEADILSSRVDASDAPPGAAPDLATAATWTGEVRQFAAWLAGMARQLPRRLARWLLPDTRGDP